MVFVASDLPPHYALDTPKEDTATGTQKPQRKQRAKAPQGNSAVRLIGGSGEVAPITPAVMIDEIIPGYVGKAKDMLDFKFARDALWHFFKKWIGIADVLYEHGFLDPTIMDKYTLDGNKVELVVFGVTDPWAWGKLWRGTKIFGNKGLPWKIWRIKVRNPDNTRKYW